MTLESVNKKIEKKVFDKESSSTNNRLTFVIKGKEEPSTKTKDKLDKKLTEKRKYNKRIFAQKLEIATRGLNYISETDADIFPFIGEISKAVTSRSLLLQIYADLDSPVEEREFEGFFKHITKIQDWHNEERTQVAKNFQKLREMLKENLTDLKVFNVGRIHIDVYVIGKDPKNNLMGIKTKAIET